MKRAQLHRWSAVTVAAVAALAAGTFAQIPDGWEIVEIFPAGTEYNCGRPDINDRGQVVFERRLWPSLPQIEIVLYDRERMVQVTDDEIRDVLPRLNNHRHIVWSRDVSENGLLSIVRLMNGKLDVISEPGHAGIDGSADINDAGSIVWSRSPTPPLDSRDVFFFNGTSIRQITDDGFSNQSTRINGAGEVVFTRYDFSVDPWLSQIFGYFSTFLSRLSNNQPQVQLPDINDHRQVVWHGPLTGVEVWENGRTTTIGGVNAGGAHINNQGEISFSQWDAVHRENGLWLWRDGFLMQLTDGAFGGNFSALNNRCEIAFQYGRSPSYGIALFTKPAFRADLDVDRDVDLQDIAHFQICYGLVGDAIEEACWASDVNNDRLVDLNDFKFVTDLIEGPAYKSEGR